jgi:hypothetical protein
MKNIFTTMLLLSFCLATAQVGIGVTNPQADLHVGGNVLVQENLDLSTFATVGATDEDFKLIALTTNSTPAGEVKVLDVDNLSAPPVSVIDYEFTNIALDNLTDLDLQYDENKYIVGIANFRYEGDAIQKVAGGGTKSIGNFVVQTFTDGGTWHLEIRNRTLDLDPSDSVNYFVTLVVYNKSYYRNLTPIITDLGGNNTGTASSVPILE